MISEAFFIADKLLSVPFLHSCIAINLFLEGSDLSS